MTDKFADIIARELNIRYNSVANTLQLLNEGCTIPFISRYRKERTGGLDEVSISAISDMDNKLNEIAKRKETIIKTITEQGKMTPEIKARIDICWVENELEDIYLPYKPKRRTRAQVAKEQGLEPLATIIMMQRDNDIRKTAARYAKGDICNVDDAIKGAMDIIAENINEDERARRLVRGSFKRDAIISSKIINFTPLTSSLLSFSKMDRESNAPENDVSLFPSLSISSSVLKIILLAIRPAIFSIFPALV